MYLDHNATSPISPAALTALTKTYATSWGNPHSPHSSGRNASEVLEQARRKVADFLRRPSAEVCFTSGATEANAWALNALKYKPDQIRLVSAVEHPSVLAWGDAFLEVDSEGRVLLDVLRKTLQSNGEKIGLVSVMAANNETGALQPVTDIAEICRDAGVPFHCDATQMPGRCAMDYTAPDLVSLSAHKFGGPRGVGALVSRIEIQPYHRGGAQERGLRGGTVNVAGAAGMAAAISEATLASPDERDKLEAAAIALGAVPRSSGAPRLPNTSCLVFDVPGDLLVMALDLAGIYCSTGSACSSGAPGRSHVLEAMGQNDVIPVRFSLGSDTILGDTIDTLRTVYRQVKQGCG